MLEPAPPSPSMRSDASKESALQTGAIIVTDPEGRAMLVAADKTTLFLDPAPENDWFVDRHKISGREFCVSPSLGKNIYAS